MKKFSIVLVAMATALAISPAAKADTFAFSYTSPGFGFATGTLTGTASGSHFDITGGSMTVQGPDAGTYLLDTANPNPFSGATSPDGAHYDNVISVSLPYLDHMGLLFTVNGTNSSPFEIRIWDNTNSPDGWEFATYNHFGSTATATFSDIGDFETFTTSGHTVTPEPSSLFLLGTGLLGLAFVASRRAKSAVQPGFSLGAL